MEPTPFFTFLTIVYFLAASVDTYGTRIYQWKRDGLIPPDVELLPLWTMVFTYLMWGIFLVLLYLNWKSALGLFVLKFILKVLPVLETVGRWLMTPYFYYKNRQNE